MPTPYQTISGLEITCPSCKGILTLTVNRGQVFHQDYSGVVQAGLLVNIGLQTDVPEAAGCLKEAAICVNNGAHRGAVVMARGALELALDWAGFPERSLRDKVARAVRSNTLDQFDETKATNARLIGNFGAHGTYADVAPGDGRMTQNDSRYVVELSAELARKIVEWKNNGGTAVP